MGHRSIAPPEEQRDDDHEPDDENEDPEGRVEHVFTLVQDRRESRRLGGAENPNSFGDAWMDLATILRNAGEPDEAEQAAREALALHESKGNRPSTASAKAFIEELRVT